MQDNVYRNYNPRQWVIKKAIVTEGALCLLCRLFLIRAFKRLVASNQSPKLPLRYHLGFVSDGSDFQILGIMMVVNQLLNGSPQFMEHCSVWVGMPVDCQKRSAVFFDLFRDRTAVRFFATRRQQNDPYYVKFGLIDLLNDLNVDDGFLYLDYDHLVCDVFSATSDSSRGILVSSEVKSLSPNVAIETCAESGPVPLRLFKHFNNSLILGSVAQLRNVTGFWQGAYQRLPFLLPEQREEIAFCAAASEAGESLIAAPHALQEHFRSSSAESVLFHYGGTTPAARQLKQSLRARATRFHWTDFTAGCLHREHQFMLRQLASLRMLSL